MSDNEYMDDVEDYGLVCDLFRQWRSQKSSAGKTNNNFKFRL